MVTDASGNLRGYNGIAVDGSFYDVSFVDSSCVTLFSGCNDNADFPFAGSSPTYGAMQELGGMITGSFFEHLFSKIHGCTTAIASCNIITPYEYLPDGTTGVPGPLVQGHFLQISGLVDPTAFPQIKRQPGADLGDSAYYQDVYAVWAPVGVPEPMTLSLLALGILMFRTDRTRKLDSSAR
ncbi:MAG: PEP-CTERM sorting domain-containing protein [bacterium]|nr:PEP-CTERM sorting domain-containing protein [bacterium]